MAISLARDNNRITGIGATSNADGLTVLPVYVDSATNRLLVQATISGGGFSSASVGPTGSAVPTSADFIGVNVAGTLRGATASNPTGSVYSIQTDMVALNGNTVAAGNGVSGTSVQRVVLASDQTAFSVNATLSAETTKVIGTVNIAANQTVGLVAGSAIIGKVGIDQTTPGTTNLVALAANQSVNMTQLAGVAVSAGNGVSGTGVQRVTLASDSTGQVAIAAGAATIGSIASITTSIVPGTGATNLGKAEDNAHASGDTGVAAWAVRNDNLATTYGQDQDYTPIAVDLKGAVITTQKAATSATTSVAGSATTVSLLTANASRRGAVIANDSTAILYVKLGATASTTSYAYKLFTDDEVEIPFGYTGAIDGIWASAAGNARITELT